MPLRIPSTRFVTCFTECEPLSKLFNPHITLLATKIKDMPDAAWDKYDDRVFITAYQDWQKEVDGLADVDDLPDDKTMADDLERLIWALWVPRLAPRKFLIGLEEG